MKVENVMISSMTWFLGACVSLFFVLGSLNLVVYIVGNAQLGREQSSEFKAQSSDFDFQYLPHNQHSCDL